MVARVHGDRMEGRCNMVILVGKLVVSMVRRPGIARRTREEGGAKLDYSLIAGKLG